VFSEEEGQAALADAVKLALSLGGTLAEPQERTDLRVVRDPAGTRSACSCTETRHASAGGDVGVAWAAGPWGLGEGLEEGGGERGPVAAGVGGELAGERAAEASG
jgi:hypothetical protein